MLVFNIIGDTIHVTRGDKCTIELTLNGYIFSVGDIIEFRVYEKKSLDKPPVLSKRIEVTDEGLTVNIELTSEDTKIGEIQNKVQTYWYEIELNDNQTVIGYDDKGAKEFILYPEGAEEDVTT